MNASESHPQVGTRSFPLLLLVSSVIPICGLIVVALLALTRSDYAFPIAFFSVVLAAASAIIGLLGLAFRERPWWLLLVGLAPICALLMQLFHRDPLTATRMRLGSTLKC